MTSPNLPTIPNGIIWDGVTEYLNRPPSDRNSVYLLRMVGDGSRRYTEYYATDRPFQDLIRLSTQNDAWETIGITYENGGQFLWDNNHIAYLYYDGSLKTEPVNQMTYIAPYRAHAARFAHELDAALGHATMQDAEEVDRRIVRQTISAMIGSAERKYAAWEDIDPEELIVGGVNDGELLWQHSPLSLAEHAEIDIALCGQCDVDVFGKEFYFEADLSAFRRLWRQGIIYVADRSTTPWSPTIFDVHDQATSTVGEFYDELDARYHDMLRYYARVVGPADRTA